MCINKSCSKINEKLTKKTTNINNNSLKREKGMKIFKKQKKKK